MRKKIVGGVIAAAAAGVAIVAIPGTASAAHARHTGPHTVCADSLWVHTTDGSPNFYLNWGSALYIHDFRDNGGRAMVTVSPQDREIRGWVYNGYFC